MEPCSDPLSQRRIRKEIADNLLDGELIERHILVHGLDHPIPKFPRVAELIGLKPIGTRIPRQI